MRPTALSPSKAMKHCASQNSNAGFFLGFVIFIASIPIAVAANAFRVSATGVISEYNPEAAKGFFHTLEGGVAFGFAFALMVLFHLVIKKMPGFRAPRPVAGGPGPVSDSFDRRTARVVERPTP